MNNKLNPIPLVDLKANYDSIKAEIDATISETLNSTAFIGGSRVSEFEKAFAEFTGAKYAIGASSGTTALHLALIGANVQPGDEVILPSHTFIATVEPVIQCGAIPVFADIDEESFTIDPAHVEKLITNRTRAIIAVHIYGRCCDMTALLDIANRHSVALVEDSAQAHGAYCKAGRAGAIGVASAFSFYPGKNLGAFGDAGIVTTNNEEIAFRLQMLANHGRRDKYEHDLIGYNYRLDSLQAAILSVKLQHLEKWNSRRHALAARYNAAFEGTDIIVPQVTDGHVFHLYVVRVGNRELLQSSLKQRGIATGVHYPIPCHKQPCMVDFHAQSLPVTEGIVEGIVSLPLYPELTKDQQDYVIESVLEVSVPAQRIANF